MEARGLAMPLLPGDGDRHGTRTDAAATATAPTDGASASYYAMFMKAIHAGGLHGGIFHEEGPLTLLQCMERAAHECLALVDEALVRKGFSGRAYEDALGRALDTFNHWTDAMLGEETQRIVDAHPQIDTVLFRAVCATYVRHVHGDVLRASGQRASIRVPPFGNFVREFFRHLAADVYVRSAAYFDRARLAERKLVHADAVRAALDLCMRGNVTYVAAPLPPPTPSSTTSASSPMSSTSSSTTTTTTSSSSPSSRSSPSALSTTTTSVSSTPAPSSLSSSLSTSVSAATPAPPRPSSTESPSAHVAPAPISPLAPPDAGAFPMHAPHALAAVHASGVDQGARAGALVAGARTARVPSTHGPPVGDVGMRHAAVETRPSRPDDIADRGLGVHQRTGLARQHRREMGPYDPNTDTEGENDNDTGDPDGADNRAAVHEDINNGWYGDDNNDNAENGKGGPYANTHRSFGLRGAERANNSLYVGNGAFSDVRRSAGVARADDNDPRGHQRPEDFDSDRDDVDQQGGAAGGHRPMQPLGWGARQSQGRINTDRQAANPSWGQSGPTSWNHPGRDESHAPPPHRPAWPSAQVSRHGAPPASGGRRAGARPLIRLIDQPAMPHYVPGIQAPDNPMGGADNAGHVPDWPSAAAAAARTRNPNRDYDNGEGNALRGLADRDDFDRGDLDDDDVEDDAGDDADRAGHQGDTDGSEWTE
ncbi:DNA polymerase III gamma/tau subunit-like domain-containing protein [Pandoravirus kuranda]|uniref:DNA polymerase III gamma/tau subunit-like domain-containing protein n=1 Tax=Pandoravirus kuranda TaxID=3019033 RepID=A0AA95ECR6_9VIRU|nr:DNA polymerase III gamma/tau subunit-like domain-containing protein [Pandoravirus kuranda]